jgi:hypothetical protein
MPQIELDILPKGTHRSGNGHTLNATDKELDDLVASYDPASFQAPLIITHDTKGVADSALHATEFAYGVPSALKRVGDKVKAVFDNVAPEFRNWVKENKLTSVSPSFYLPNSPNNPTPGKLALRHIAALGATPPAIKALSGSLKTAFNFEESSGDGAIDFNFEVDPDTLEFCGCGGEYIESNIFQRLRDWLIDEYSLETADKIIPAFELGILMERRMDNPLMERLIKLEDYVHGQPKDAPAHPIYTETMPEETKTPDFAEQEAKLIKMAADLAQREAKLRRSEYTNFCETELKAKLTPAIAATEEVVAFMEFLSVSQPMDFSEENKQQSPLDWFKGLMTRIPDQVNFSEVASGAPVDVGNSAPAVTGVFNASEVDLDRQIRSYMQQHGVEYAEAWRQIRGN